MTTNSSSPPLPNPLTPLAFLPPTIAAQFQAAAYISVATLSAYTWDWLVSIPEEIKICRSGRLRLGIIAYFLSRIGTLGYCLTASMFQITNVAHCNAFDAAIGVCFVVAIPSTSALFVLRVRAVYCNNKIITIFFNFLLFSLFALCFLVIPAIKGVHIGTTQICINNSFANYASVPVVLNTVIDTLVFFAISLRIISYSLAGDTFEARMRSFFRGEGLPSLSRSLLQGGQLYYFTTIGFNIVTVALLFAPVPAITHVMMAVPGIALGSSMACRVFRGVLLGLVQDVGARSGSTNLNTTLFFAQRPHHSDVSTSTAEEHALNLKTRHSLETSSPARSIAVDMKTTESGDPHSKRKLSGLDGGGDEESAIVGVGDKSDPV